MAKRRRSPAGDNADASGRLTPETNHIGESCPIAKVFPSERTASRCVVAAGLTIVCHGLGTTASCVLHRAIIEGGDVRSCQESAGERSCRCYPVRRGGRWSPRRSALHIPWVDRYSASAGKKPGNLSLEFPRLIPAILLHCLCTRSAAHSTESIDPISCRMISSDVIGSTATTQALSSSIVSIGSPQANCAASSRARAGEGATAGTMLLTTGS